MAAQFQELVPVGGVYGEPGAFQSEHDPGPAQGHLGDELLESFPVGGGGAGVALVDELPAVCAVHDAFDAAPRRRRAG